MLRKPKEKGYEKWEGKSLSELETKNWRRQGGALLHSQTGEYQEKNGEKKLGGAKKFSFWQRQAWRLTFANKRWEPQKK